MGQVPQDGNFAQNVALFFKCGLGKYKDNKEKEEGGNNDEEKEEDKTNNKKENIQIRSLFLCIFNR